MRFSRRHRRPHAAVSAVLTTAAMLGLQHASHAAADANASAAVQNELNYITSLRDQGLVLSTQTIANPWHVDDLETNPPGDYMSEITRVNQMTGKFPAMIGLDFLNCDAYPDHGASIINLAKNYAGRGGLIQFQFHEGSPRAWAPEGSSFYSAVLNGAEWNDLLNNPGSALHQNWQHHMDLVAGWLGQLQQAGVVVLWRPYHEGDGNWFWWGASPGNYQALWRMQFNYLVNVKGLHNLIWVLSTPNAGYYPGPNYVDIAGGDIYSANTTDGTYAAVNNNVKSFALGQPTALTECGLLPDTNYIHQIGYAYVDIWGGPFLDPSYYPTGGGGAFNNLQSVQNFYNEGRTITLSQVAVPTPAVSANTWYHIVNQNSGKLLAVQYASGADGALIQQYHDNGTPDHNWKFIPLPNGGFKIVNQNSGKPFGVAGMGQGLGNQVMQWSDNGTIDHNWELVSQGNGQYHIVNQNSGLLLGIGGGSTDDSAGVVQWSDSGAKDQNWALVPVNAPLVSGQRYHLVNAHSGLFLDNPWGTNVHGTLLQQFVNTYSTAQQWTATYVGGNNWTFANVAGGLAIDDLNWSTIAGTQIGEWDNWGGATQQWQPVAVGDGTYKLLSAVSNLPMEVQGANIANGGSIGQWYDNGNACQHWIFQTP